jgi:photosystem II stability/assembly factor-like uncharacterized protein
MKRRLGVGVLFALLSALSGCTAQTDLKLVEAERAKPLKRYDTIQALAGNGGVVVAASQAGAVLVSADQGKNWKRQALGQVSLVDLAVCPDGSFVGIDFYHKVWSADQKGEGWKSVALEKPRTALAVACDSQSRWWLVGTGSKIAVSADKGATWTLTDMQEDAQFTTIQFVDDKVGYVLGEFGNVVATEDGGASWKRISQIPGEFYPYAALFRDRKEGWASGIAGQILKTSDGGKTWNKSENRSGAPLYRLFLHGGQPYGVGAGGVVARLEQGVWQSLPYPDAAPVFLGSGATLGTHQNALIIGGPGGLARVIATGKEGQGS